MNTTTLKYDPPIKLTKSNLHSLSFFCGSNQFRPEFDFDLISHNYFLELINNGCNCGFIVMHELIGDERMVKRVNRDM